MLVALNEIRRNWLYEDNTVKDLLVRVFEKVLKKICLKETTDIIIDMKSLEKEIVCKKN